MPSRVRSEFEGVVLRSLTCFASLTFISACGSSPTSQHIVHDPVHNVDFIVKHWSGPPLSLSTDRVYAVVDSKQKLIFEGYGARPITLKPHKKGAIIIEYCAGLIRSTNSFLLRDDGSGRAIAVTVQPIVVEAMIGDVPLCVSK